MDIQEIKREIARLFRENEIEDGLTHSTFKDYIDKKINGEFPGHRPYVDKRVKFKNIRKLNKLMDEIAKGDMT